MYEIIYFFQLFLVNFLMSSVPDLKEMPTTYLISALVRDVEVSDIYRNREHLGHGVIVGIEKNTVRILTANHVVKTPGIIHARLDSTYSEFQAKIIFRIPGQDLALLEITVPQKKSSILKNITPSTQSDPVNYEKMFMGNLGISRGIVGNLNLGFIHSKLFRELHSQQPYIIYSTSCKHGDSGDGVYDYQGHLIGIVIAINKVEFDKSYITCYAEPVTDISNILAHLPHTN